MWNEVKLGKGTDSASAISLMNSRRATISPENWNFADGGGRGRQPCCFGFNLTYQGTVYCQGNRHD